MPANKTFERRCPYILATRLQLHIEKRCGARRKMLDLSAVVKQGVNIAQMIDLRTAARFFAAQGVPIEIAVRVLSGEYRATDRIPPA